MKIVTVLVVVLFSASISTESLPVPNCAPNDLHCMCQVLHVPSPLCK